MPLRVLASTDSALNQRGEKNSYNIIVEEGLFSKEKKLERFIALRGKPTSCAVITDLTVANLYGSAILHSFSRFAKTDMIKIHPGERSKTFNTCIDIIARLARLGFDRNGLLILLGGGVVGDIGGFAASIYKRGVKYIQIPTTLLAQIDSSIGGKTGVDADWGKNQIGTIYQPIGVLIDPSFLKTLPDHEILNGIGEMVKYGVIASRKIFEELEGKNINSISKIVPLIEPCCKIKAGIVSKDPGDNGIRSVLNYGHTIGHALEAASEYKISHGVAVLVGMLAEGWISREMNIFENEDFQRQEQLIKRLLERWNKDNPTRVKMQKGAVVKYAFSDKKNVGGKVRMSLPERIGIMHPTKEGTFKTIVSFDLLKYSIDYVKSVLPRN
jgi:3-dehydroquinate synthase